ncbi:MAG: hybrid sensor histidine kinase/response regulator [Thermoguttaceae bacterium]
MSRTRVRTLLVEDNPDDAAFVREALAGADPADFQLKHVDRLAAAGTLLEAESFDVILLDLGLPDAHDLQALLRIRRLCPETPVVVLTGNSDPAVGVDAVAHGAQDYLYKGDVSSRSLERVLRYALQRQQMLIQLQRANDLLDQNNKRLAQLYETAHQFVDNVSHEFRTPLTVIKEYVTLIRDGLVGHVSTQQRGFLDVASDRVDDLTIMVDDMLDVSKLEAGLLRVWRRASRLDRIVDHVRPALERKAAIRKVLLEITLDDGLPEVYCDGEKIGRVITNLVTNAIKFSGELSFIRLWARHDAEAGEVHVGVSDNGPGIDPDNLQLIFERFHQVQGATRNSTKGFGLGLGIAKELVALNLGQIDVESQPGQGATFSFSVPIFEPRELVARYLSRLNHLESPGTAALLTAELPGGVLASPSKACLSDLADELIQGLFRGDDLVVQCEPDRWVVVARCPERRTDAIVDRVRGGWNDATRNMPGTKLSAIGLDVKGVWAVQTQSEQLIERFRAELPSPACTACRGEDPR